MGLCRRLRFPRHRKSCLPVVARGAPVVAPPHALHAPGSSSSRRSPGVHRPGACHTSADARLPTSPPGRIDRRRHRRARDALARARHPLGYDRACLLPFPPRTTRARDPEPRWRRAPNLLGRLSNGNDPALNPAAWKPHRRLLPSALPAYFERTTRARSSPCRPARSVTGYGLHRHRRHDHRRVRRALLRGRRHRWRGRTPGRHPPPRSASSPGHRYAVAITRAVQAPPPGDAPPSPGFPRGARRRRLHRRASQPRRAATRRSSPPSGAPASSAPTSCSRGDFTTASERFLTGPVVAMRDRAMAMVGERGAGFLHRPRRKRLQRQHPPARHRHLPGPLPSPPPTRTPARSPATPTAPPRRPHAERPLRRDDPAPRR